RGWERKRAEPGRMAAEGDAVPLGRGDQAAANPGPAQIGMYPKQVHEKPASITVADQPGADRRALIANEDAEIAVGRVVQKRRVIFAEAIVDDIPVVPRWVVLEGEPEPGRQVHRSLHLSHNIYYGKSHHPSSRQYWSLWFGIK